MNFFLPRSTSHVKYVFYPIFVQQVTEKFSVRIRSFLVSSDVMLPNLRRLPIGVLIWDARNTDT